VGPKSPATFLPRSDCGGALRRARSGMVDATQIGEHMEVVGSDGGHVGVVDKVEGERIKLTRKDPQAGGQHHYLPLSAVDSVNGNVRLSMASDEAMRQWQAEPAGAGPGGQ